MRAETAFGTATTPPGTDRRPHEDEIDAHGVTHPGKVRRENQDHFLLCSLRRQVLVRASSIPEADDLLGESTRLASLAMVADYVGQAEAWQRARTALPFATVARSLGRAVGSTRFANIDVANRRAEIGWTWLAADAQRTPVNTEAKYLMLRHAFEVQGAVRVQLKTDERNEQSRRAILGLGAAFEGILRNYQTRAHDEYVRNTAMYSITRKEWPDVKARLEAKLLR